MAHIQDIPLQLIIEILLQVLLSDGFQAFTCLASTCTQIWYASKDPQIYSSCSLNRFTILTYHVWELSTPQEVAFLDNCQYHQNPEALFRRGFVSTWIVKFLYIFIQIIDSLIYLFNFFRSTHIKTPDLTRESIIFVKLLLGAMQLRGIFKASYHYTVQTRLRRQPKFKLLATS